MHGAQALTGTVPFVSTPGIQRVIYWLIKTDRAYLVVVVIFPSEWNSPLAKGLPDEGTLRVCEKCRDIRCPRVP